MDELVPQSGGLERGYDVDEPCGGIRMPGRRLVAEKNIIVEEAYGRHGKSVPENRQFVPKRSGQPGPGMISSALFHGGVCLTWSIVSDLE